MYGLFVNSITFFKIPKRIVLTAGNMDQLPCEMTWANIQPQIIQGFYVVTGYEIDRVGNICMPCNKNSKNMIFVVK